MPDFFSSRTTHADLLNGRSRCLLLGAKGAGMTALADILIDAGNTVIGMDKNVADDDFRPAVDSNAKFPVLPWSSAPVPAGQLDLCIISAAVPRNDAVPAMVLAAGVPLISLHECLGTVFSKTQQICVAGTHGKSTTTAMLSWIMEQNLYRPGFFVGAEQVNFGCSGRFTGTDWAVLESCEFLQSFRHLQPEIAVLTGIERDHFDCFPEQQSEDKAFRRFASLVPQNGSVIIRKDCVRSREIVANLAGRVSTFCIYDGGVAGENSVPANSPNLSTADFVASHVTHYGTTSTFRCSHNGKYSVVRLGVPGRHNVQNAVAAIAGAVSAGISLHASCQALASFSGICRRFENRGQYNGITLIDDYAHHPTAIRETIATARQAFPGRRILVAFEPHQLIRTESLFPQFVESLSAADEVLLLPVFPAREKATHFECCRASGRIVKELNRNGVRAFLFANLDQIVSRVDHSGRPSDIFLTMGAGRTNVIHDHFNRRLQRNFVA